MKISVATGEAYIDKGSKEIVLTIKPKLAWFFKRKHKILISKDDLKEECDSIYFY